MPKITTFLTYNDQAEEAAKFYVSIFKHSKITRITRFGAVGPAPMGSVMTVAFQLDGHEFVALNGGPHFKLTDAASLCVSCRTQAEIDAYWAALSEGGEEGPCGWLKDKFGLWWQVNPVGIERMLSHPNPARAKRVWAAAMKMRKIDIAALKRAYAGRHRPTKRAPRKRERG